MARLSRRKIVVGAAALPLMPRFSFGADVDRVRFGMLYPNLVSVIHAIAKKIGAYEKYNLQVIETPFKSGQATAGVEQLWRGNLDFYMGGAPEIPRLNSRVIESGGTAPLGGRQRDKPRPHEPRSRQQAASRSRSMNSSISN